MQYILDVSFPNPDNLFDVVLIRKKAFSAAVDLYLAIYPATVLFTLQMKRKRKIALSVALGIGSMCVPSPSLAISRED
jgi:hypothetical protein